MRTGGSGYALPVKTLTSKLMAERLDDRIVFFLPSRETKSNAFVSLIKFENHFWLKEQGF